MNDIGFRIRQLRKERNLTQVEVAVALGISRPFLTAIENGNNSPGRATLSAIAEYFQVSVDWLLAGLPTTTNTSKIHIIGEVQEGFWKTDYVYEDSKQTVFSVPFFKKYENINRYALLVMDESVNKIYPINSIIVLVDFADLSSAPSNGNYVSIIRRDHLTGKFEVSIKKLKLKKDGKIVLYSCSDDPNFEKPIILSHFSLEYTLTKQDKNTSFPDLKIQGLVIGGFRIEA
ncbi:helix-turn-helix domain-containing protein [Entomobacter blattae]|uniref:Helix-turn-helix protein n=1 Tax=Entomobacter blattae TaxID=2762277 RepID=A0A7H1NP83_9PROT|nr:helix-turn-helix transcriptional regulator [Entomobacter blattae]QNT77593.1 helix-turn-helix protein [Entomobacter blattae]